LSQASAIPAQVRALLDLYQDPAILLSHDYRILAANPAYCRLYGEHEPLSDRRCYEVSHHYSVPCDQAGESCPLKDSLASGQPARVLHVHHTPRGDEHVDVETHPVRDAQGNIAYFVEIMRQTRAASASPSERGLVGRSPAFNRMLELLQRVAPTETTVLLLGETGTGKELVAQAIHDGSPRRDGPFVPVECSGLTETLFESELFGHEKGAFTGANSRKPGLVEAARGGTLFLDEVGDIPLSMQVKLLRLLETGTYRRVGGVETLQADFRLVCATHRHLKELVADGRFRADLYYRISSFPVTLPALRERREDLPLLIETVLRRVAPDRHLTLDAAALACLRGYDFPGNVRELRNILEWASLLADGDVIGARHLPEDCRCSGKQAGAAPGGDEEIVPLQEMELRYLQRVAARFRGDRRELAERLGISERTLYRKLQSGQ
jgi:two-component system response regulator HydG